MLSIILEQVFVESITNATTIVFQVNIGADIASPNVTSIKVSRQTSSRQLAVVTDNYRIKIKPFSNLLNNVQLLPLMYMKNLQIFLKLEIPELY